MGDFGQYIAGPMVALNLADNGADVTHVNPPSGPSMPGPMTEMLNRGKKIENLDLKSEAGRARAWELIDNADVVIEGFRPGVFGRLGFDPLEIHQRNPRAVVLSLPGYASTDTERANIQAWEGHMLAHCGVFSDMGLNRMLMGCNPSYSALPLASVYGASTGTLAVNAALFARERHGCGEVIEVPLASALLDCLVYNSLEYGEVAERYKCVREREIERRVEHQLPMNLSYEELDALLDPFYRTYFCEDGRPVYIVAPCHTEHQKRTLQVLGLWDDLTADGLPVGDVYLDSEEWPQGAQCLLGTYPISSYYWMDKLTVAMTRAFASKPAFVWEEIFGKHKIPVAAHRTSREFVNSEHAVKSKLTVTVNHPTYGPMRQKGKYIWLEDGTKCTRVPSPTVEASHPGTPFLQGVKVLDMSNVIAGPTIGSYLSRFGAEVIKLDHVDPTYDALVAVLMGIPANRGKRSMLVDLKKGDARGVFEKLVRWADVVNVNQVSSQMGVLGADPATIKSINPNAILAHFDAYGGPGEGPRSGYIGYDDLVQASTGIMSRFGGSINTPEEHAHLGTVDVVSGVGGAAGVALALLYRERSGFASVSRTSLACNGMALQVPFMYDYSGRTAFTEPSGRRATGEHALYRWYRCCDGYIFMATKGDDKALAAVSSVPFLQAAFVDVPGPAASYIHSPLLAEMLMEQFCKVSVEQALAELASCEVAATAQGYLADLRKQNISAARQFSLKPGPEVDGSTMQWIRQEDHPVGEPVEMYSPCSIRPWHASVLNPCVQPQHGFQTRELLTEMGYSRDQIDQLVADRVVAEQWSSKYVPGGDPWLAQDGARFGDHVPNAHLHAHSKL